MAKDCGFFPHKGGGSQIWWAYANAKPFNAKHVREIESPLFIITTKKKKLFCLVHAETQGSSLPKQPAVSKNQISPGNLEPAL